MDAFSTVVIKVKYGDVLRRFNAEIDDDGLNLTMVELRKKISSLFSISPDTELILTYVDEDNDVVNLVDDDDIREAGTQCLDPLRITVKNGGCDSSSSESSTTTGTPQAQPTIPSLATGVSEILKTMPQPMGDALVKLAADLASKALSSGSGITDLVDLFSKVCVSYSGQLSDTRPREEPSSKQNGVIGGTNSVETKDSVAMKVGPLKNASKERSEISSRNYASSEKLKPETAEEIRNTEIMNKLRAIRHIEPFFGGVKNLQNFSTAFSDLQSVPTIVATPEEGNSNSVPESNHADISISDPKSREYYDVRERPVFPDTLGKQGPIRALNPTNDFVQCKENFPPPATEASSVRSISQNGDRQKVIHRGVHCDVCGVHPITGPRFKSKVMVNYDLCSSCFGKMGDESDYIRMDVPVDYRNDGSFKSLFEALARNDASALPQIKPVSVTLDSRFIQDVNIADGTLMAPLTPFTKIWRMMNNGTAVWKRGTHLVWIGGDRMSNKLSAELKIPVVGLWPEREVDVMVDFVTPEFPGQYISYWRMATTSGEHFGQHVWVLIQVDNSIEKTPHESIRNLNLNLPPETYSETVTVSPQPVQRDNPKKPVETVKPSSEQKWKFPINDSLVVGNDARSSVPPSVVPSISYPTIDPFFPPTLHPLPKPTQLMETDAGESPKDHLSEIKQAEKKFLKQLDEMGFKLEDLNKEILRLNDYNLEDTLADLCGVMDCDPLPRA